MKLQEIYDRTYAECIHESDQQLIKKLNSQVGNKGWGQAKAQYLKALRDALTFKKIDASRVDDDNSFSYAQKMILRGKTLYSIADPVQKSPLEIVPYEYGMRINDQTPAQIILFPFLSSYHIPCDNRKQTFELQVWERLDWRPKTHRIFPSQADGEFVQAVAGEVMKISKA